MVDFLELFLGFLALFDIQVAVFLLVGSAEPHQELVSLVVIYAEHDCLSGCLQTLVTLPLSHELLPEGLLFLLILILVIVATISVHVLHEIIHGNDVRLHDVVVLA